MSTRKVVFLVQGVAVTVFFEELAEFGEIARFDEPMELLACVYCSGSYEVREGNTDHAGLR